MGFSEYKTQTGTKLRSFQMRPVLIFRMNRLTVKSEQLMIPRETAVRDKVGSGMRPLVASNITSISITELPQCRAKHLGSTIGCQKALSKVAGLSVNGQ